MLTFANIKTALFKKKWLCQAGLRAIGRSERSERKSERSLAENLVKPSIKLQKYKDVP